MTLMLRRSLSILALLVTSACAGGRSVGPEAPAEPGTVRGTVRDGRGLAVGSISLIAKSLDGRSARAGYTDHHGVYQIPALPPGRYRVMLLRGGRVLGSQPVFLGARATVDLHFILGAPRPADPSELETRVSRGPLAGPISR